MPTEMATDLANVDFLDRGPRLVRFFVAVAIGAALTVLALRGMRAIGGPPNADPLSAGSVWLVAIGCFTALSMLALSALTAIARRRSRPAAEQV